MNSEIIINQRIFQKRQIGYKKYNILVYYLDKFQFQFKVSLQPTENFDNLPIFQLYDKSENIPEWTKNELNTISSWIKIEDEDD